jgi:anti-anti-sigma regulatory factor
MSLRLPPLGHSGVAGDLDMESAAELRDCLRDAEELEPLRTIADLSDIDLMDSAGLAMCMVAAPGRSGESRAKAR